MGGAWLDVCVATELCGREAVDVAAFLRQSQFQVRMSVKCGFCVFIMIAQAQRPRCEPRRGKSDALRWEGG